MFGFGLPPKTTVTSLGPRAAAEAKVEAALKLCETEPEQALLFHILRTGLDWDSVRAKRVLVAAKWWMV